MATISQIQVKTDNQLLASFTSFINSMINQIMQYIAKLALAAVYKKLAFGFGAGSGTGFGGGGASDIPMMPIASANTGSGYSGASHGYMPTLSNNNPRISPSSGVSNTTLINAINELRQEIANDRVQNFNLIMDGLAVRNGIKRAERNQNALGQS